MTDWKGIPMSKAHIALIEQGKKWTTLRSLKYDSFPFEKEKVWVTENPSAELLAGEGYPGDRAGWLVFMTRPFRAHKLPKFMWLYDLRKPKEAVSNG